MGDSHIRSSDHGKPSSFLSITVKKDFTRSDWGKSPDKDFRYAGEVICDVDRDLLDKAVRYAQSNERCSAFVYQLTCLAGKLPKDIKLRYSEEGQTIVSSLGREEMKRFAEAKVRGDVHLVTDQPQGVYKRKPTLMIYNQVIHHYHKGLGDLNPKDGLSELRKVKRLMMNSHMKSIIAENSDLQTFLDHLKKIDPSDDLTKIDEKETDFLVESNTENNDFYTYSSYYSASDSEHSENLWGAEMRAQSSSSWKRTLNRALLGIAILLTLATAFHAVNVAANLELPGSPSIEMHQRLRERNRHNKLRGPNQQARGL